MKEIVIVNGSGRQINKTSIVVNMVEKELISYNRKFTIINAIDYQLIDNLEHIKEKFLHTAIIWISPEYNWSYSAAIKRLIEQLTVEVLQTSISGIISVSSGSSSHSCLGNMASLLFAMRTTIVSPGVEVNQVTEGDTKKFEMDIRPLIKNIIYFQKRVF